VAERLDRTLLNLTLLSPKLGKRIELANGRDYPVGYAEDDEVFDFLLGQLQRSGYLDSDEARASGDEVPPAVRLNVDGWNYVAELQRARAGTDPLQAFVGMAFRDDVKAAYTEGIEPGIQDAGYNSLRIDRKEHNNKIDDEIFAEIRKSRFVVADFTHHRGGVYLEAGFAQGLDLPVIWTVRKDQIKKCHFDTRQYNHIDWTTPQELRERLRLRIEATIGRPSR
jgi:hypothetical protein